MAYLPAAWPYLSATNYLCPGEGCHYKESILTAGLFLTSVVYGVNYHAPAGLRLTGHGVSALNARPVPAASGLLLVEYDDVGLVFHRAVSAHSRGFLFSTAG